MQLEPIRREPGKPETVSLLARIPDGRAGVLVTLQLMRRLARAAKKSLPVRLLSLELTNGSAQKDWIGEVRALHVFVRDRIRYVRDIRGVETLQTPEKTLELQQGDCDDKSTLLASMLESIGHPTRFVAVGFRPGRFSHVYVETKIGPKWIAAETTEPVDLGWSPRNVQSTLIVHN